MKGTSQGDLAEAFREGREGPPGVNSRRPIPPPNVRFSVVAVIGSTSNRAMNGTASKPILCPAPLSCRDSGLGCDLDDPVRAALMDTPTANLIRQVLGAVSEFEKAMVVSKLKGARDRKRATGVKVEGCKSYAELAPEMVRLAKKLHRYPANGRRRSLRDVSAAPAQAGFLASSGKPYAAAAIARMVDRQGP